MSPLTRVVDARTIEILGWALVHFLWQGALLAILLAAALRLLRRSKPQARYIAATAVLGLMAACLPATIVWQVRGSALATASARGEQSGTEQSGGVSDRNITTAAQPIEGSGTAAAPAARASTSATAQRSDPRLPRQASTPFVVDRVRQAIVPWLAWLVAAWVLGVALFSSRLGLCWVRIQRVRRKSHQPAAANWQAALKRVASRLGVMYPVQLVESALIEVPTVIGWLRPIVLLPASALTGLTPTEIEALLAHELAHIRRHDYLVNLLQSGVETLLFYHPAVWWVSAYIRQTREHCCDDVAAAVCGSAVDYARTLALLEELRHAPAVLVVAASGGSLLERIRRLAGQTETAHAHGGVPAIPLLFSLFVAFSLYAVNARSAGEPKAKSRQAANDKIEEATEASVTGRLLDTRGQPVSDALVWLVVEEIWEHSADGPPVIAQAQSTADGRFELKPLQSAVNRFVKNDSTQFQLCVRKPGLAFVRRVTRGSLPDKHLEIKMEPEPATEFILRNPDKSPCPDATVTVTSAKFAESDYQSIPKAIRRHFEARSYADGRFTIHLARENIVGLEFETHELGRQYYGFYAQGRRIPTDLTLRKTGTIVGRLVLPLGERADLSSVKIRIVTLETTEHGQDEMRAGLAVVQPNREGNFTIPTIAEGTIRVFVDEPDGLGYRSDPPAQELPLTSGITATLEVPMHPAVRITRLIHEAGTDTPIPGVRVHMQNGVQHIDARTDRNGRFAAWILPDVQYHTVYNLADEFISQWTQVSSQIRVPTGQDEYELDPLEFLRGRTIEGIVVDPAGQPLADVRVGANWHDPGEDFGIEAVGAAVNARQWGTSDDAGRFRIRGVYPQADITVTPVRAQVVLGKSVQVAADDDDSVRLQTDEFEFRSLNGRIVDLDGAPIAGAEVILQVLRAEKIYAAVRLISDAKGRFQTPPHLPKQFDYRVMVQSKRQDVASSPWMRPAESGDQFPDFAVDRSKLALQEVFPPAEKKEVAVDAATAALAVAADDKPADEVTGTLVSTNDQPIVEFKVEAFRQTGRPEEAFVTDDNGEFRVPASWFRDPLFAGESYVCIARDSAGGLGWIQIQSSSAIARNVGNPEVPRPKPFRFALLATERTITGRILGPEQQPLTGVRIQVQRLAHPRNGDLYLYGFGMADELPLPSVMTDESGRFQLKLPKDAKIMLHALHPAWVVRYLAVGERDDLDDAVMVAAGRIAGTVVVAETGQPAPGVIISATRQNAAGRRNQRGEDSDANLGMDGLCVTDAEGKYEIGGLKADSHEMYVNAGPDHRDLLGPNLQGVDVRTGETTTVDITVQKGRRVAGRVVEADSGKPIPDRRVYVYTFRDRERRSLISSPYPKTNDLGEFECYVLPGFAQLRVEASREESLKMIPESKSELEIGDRGLVPPVVLKLRAPTPAELRRLVLKPTLHFNTRPNSIGGFAFDHEGKTLVTAGSVNTDDDREGWKKGTTRGDLRIWDAGTSAEIARYEGEFGGLFDVAISPDGTALATAGRVFNSADAGEVRIWDLKTRQARAVLEGHTGWVLAVTYSPWGKFIVSGSFDRTARVWDAATGKELTALVQSSTPNFLRFSRDGRTLVVGCRGGSIKLYDAGTWKERRALEMKDCHLFDVELSPDGNLLAAAGALYEADGKSSNSSTPGIIRIWDAATGQERRSWRVQGWSDSIAFSPDGKHLADARFTSSVWDVETGEELAVIFRSVSSSGDQIRYSPDGKSLAIGGHQGLQFWDVSPLLPAGESAK